MARLTTSDSAFERKLERSDAARVGCLRVAEDVRKVAASMAADRIPSFRIAAAIQIRDRDGEIAVRSDTTGIPDMPAKVPRWSQDGTGIYGLRGRMIRPKNSKYLKFWWKKTQRVMFLKAVRGRKPTYFMTDAAAAVARRHRGLEWRTRR